jgi:alpha-ketoglutarate-dependent taurine dioxygenase
MSSPREPMPNPSSPYVTEGLADETAIVQWLDDTPTYNGVLRVFRGDFSPESFTQALEESTKYEIIEGAEGPYSAIQGTQGTADRSKRSDPFDYHTDGFFFDTPPGLLKFRYISKSLQRYSRPLVETHPVDGLPISNLVTRGYVEPEVVDEKSLAALPDFRYITEAMSALYSAIDDSVVYEHSWRPGDVLLADNHTFLHARLAATPDAARRLSRIWLGQAVELGQPAS